MNYEKLGKRVKKARKEKGYTQAQLAEITGYSVQHISHVETGNTKLSVDLLVELSKALGASLDFLLADSLEREDAEGFVVTLEGTSANERLIITNVLQELQRSLREAGK